MTPETQTAGGRGATVLWGWGDHLLNSRSRTCWVVVKVR